VVVEQHTIPAFKVACRGDVGSFGVERRTFGYSPMGGDAIAVYTETSASGLGDEAKVLEFTEPALHRSGRFGAKVFGGIAGGPINLSVV
jgi:hypothetical protein